ncbi:hypothetical protein DFH09DRAFT_838148, partial [Mycena vulgaris]
EDDFRFDVQGTARSAWNKSAARTFANISIQQLVLPNTLEMVNAIIKAFETYLEAIIRRYKVSLKTQDQQAQLKSKLSHHGRKYQVCLLFHRRRYIGYTFHPLQKHIDMLEHLGVDGMSSDESEKEDNQVEYKILAPGWRAPEVAPWLRVFDTIHNIIRTAGEPQVLRGSFPHRRILTGKKSSSKKFVPGLPVNIYDPSWLAREQLNQHILHPSMETYDFNHEPNILQYVLSIL